MGEKKKRSLLPVNQIMKSKFSTRSQRRLWVGVLTKKCRKSYSPIVFRLQLYKREKFKKTFFVLDEKRKNLLFYFTSFFTYFQQLRDTRLVTLQSIKIFSLSRAQFHRRVCKIRIYYSTRYSWLRAFIYSKNNPNRTRDKNYARALVKLASIIF